MEEWKQIIDYPNYSVSNFGNVRNDKTNLNLKGYFRGGYLSVCLNKKHLPIHRLVGLYFIQNNYNLIQIDHIDNNKLNNNVNNLRWVNNQQNSSHRRKRVNQITTSKYKGVHFCKTKNKWIAGVRINGKRIHLGCFDNEMDAGKAYNDYIKDNGLEEFFILND